MTAQAVLRQNPGEGGFEIAEEDLLPGGGPGVARHRTLGEERVVDGRQMFGVASAGAFFAMADAEEVRGAL